MSTAKRLGWIVAGYVLAFAGGVAAVMVNEALMPAEISQTSGGMVAFGDMVLFVLVTGFIGLLPTFLLLRLWLEKSPRTLLAALLIPAAIGPLAWLSVTAMAATTTPGGPSLQNLTETSRVLIGTLIAFVAIPRMVLGPVLIVVEGITVVMVRTRRTRLLLAGAMLLDIVPLGLFALHMARGMLRY